MPDEIQAVLDRFDNKIPPEAKIGICVVCETRTVTETFHKEFHKPMRFGSADKGFWVSSGLACTTCGIQYAKAIT